MNIGPLFIGWSLLSNAECIALGLDPDEAPNGWEALVIKWREHGLFIAARGKA